VDENCGKSCVLSNHVTLSDLVAFVCCSEYL